MAEVVLLEEGAADLAVEVMTGEAGMIVVFLLEVATVEDTVGDPGDMHLIEKYKKPRGSCWSCKADRHALREV